MIPLKSDSICTFPLTLKELFQQHHHPSFLSEDHNNKIMTGVIETLKWGKTLHETRAERTISREGKSTQPHYFQTALEHCIVYFQNPKPFYIILNFNKNIFGLSDSRAKHFHDTIETLKQNTKEIQFLPHLLILKYFVTCMTLCCPKNTTQIFKEHHRHSFSCQESY